MGYFTDSLLHTAGYMIDIQNWDIKDKFYTLIEKLFNFLIAKPVNVLRDIGKQK